jgi:hypothetical protein
MWEAWTLSRQLSCRPSELYGITDDLQRYCFDKSVIVFGNFIEGEMKDAAEGSKDQKKAEAKARAVLYKYLEMTPDGQDVKEVAPATTGPRQKASF